MLKPIFVGYVMFSLNVAIVEVSVKYFTGVANIAFDDQSYSTNISVFPSIDLIGNSRGSQHKWFHFSGLE